MDITELKVVMLRNNITSADLANKLNISKSAMSKKINGVNEFTRKDIIKLKKILGLTPALIDQIFFNNEVDLKSIQYTK